MAFKKELLVRLVFKLGTSNLDCTVFLNCNHCGSELETTASNLMVWVREDAAKKGVAKLVLVLPQR